MKFMNDFLWSMLGGAVGAFVFLFFHEFVEAVKHEIRNRRNKKDDV